MPINTYLLTELPKEQALNYLKQIAKWHFDEWGKYSPETSEKDWEDRLIAGYADPNVIRIIAKDETDKLLGSLSLKLDYMKDDFPNFSPWLSGLYIGDKNRGKGIAGLLINSLAKTALEKGFNNIYVFTHDLSLGPFYKKLGWDLIKPLLGDHYIYKKSPILLMKANTNKVLAYTNRYTLISTEPSNAELIEFKK